jgi:hypothetical protein
VRGVGSKCPKPSGRACAVWGKKPKRSRRGSVLANETWGGFFSGRGDPIGAGYTVVEVVVGCDWVRHEGGLVVAKKAKPSCGALVLVNEMWGAFLLGRGDPIGVGYAVVEVVVGCDWVRCEGWLVVAIKAKPSRGGSALANETRRDLVSGRGVLLGQRKLGFEGWEEGIYRHMRVGDLGGQKSETELLGSVSGAPLETAVQGEGGR